MRDVLTQRLHKVLPNKAAQDSPNHRCTARQAKLSHAAFRHRVSAMRRQTLSSVIPGSFKPLTCAVAPSTYANSCATLSQFFSDASYLTHM